ncbi:MAG: hypothetical protein ACLP59_23895 [Bryobacteraceae bacterium]
MISPVRGAALLAIGGALCAQPTPPPTPRVLARHYTEGEKLVYRMKGVNEDWRYEALASGVVKKDAKGVFIEDFAWSNLISNGAPYHLPQASLDFRQVLSLDPRKLPGLPKLAGLDLKLIGPVTDLLTFYSDAWLAGAVGNLSKPGDHRYQAYGTPNSWADGSRVVLGEDAIDFDITLQSVDDAAKLAILLVRHVSPPKPKVKLPAPWMQAPVADVPNNWVQVERDGAKYIAAVGLETFDVQVRVSLADGKILGGTIQNPVKVIERDCKDEALAYCGDPRHRQIMRRIEISLIN